MKKVIVVLIVFLHMSALATSESTLLEAEKAYDSKQYSQAVTLYEQVVAQGFKSAELYYNLGNAYLRSNKIGKAIYNYERARKINPTDEDISINLGIAQSRTIDKIDSHENYFISVVKSGVLSSMSTTAWAWLTVMTLFLAALTYFFFKHASTTALRRTMFFSSVVLLIVFAITYLFGNSAMNAKYENKFAIITAAEVKIMNEPTESAKTAFTLHEGTKIRVLESNGDWVLIKLDNGNEGWLRLSDVGVV